MIELWKLRYALRDLMRLSFGTIMRKTGLAKKYTIFLPFFLFTYSPWFEDWFKKIYRKIKGHTTLTEDRAYVVHVLCKHAGHLEGDFAECGVYKGGVSYLLADTLRNMGVEKKIYLFDTFTGMPPSANDDPCGMKEGAFGDVDVSEVGEYLEDFENIEFVQGVMPETFENLGEKRYAFVHLDVDLYQSVKDCCEYLYPRMSKGGIMLFDDYGDPLFKRSAKKAVDEFFADKIETPLSLPTKQCVVIKL